MLWVMSSSNVPFVFYSWYQKRISDYISRLLCYVLSQRGVGNWTDFFFIKKTSWIREDKCTASSLCTCTMLEWSAASWVILKPPTKSYVVICLVKFLSWYEVKRSLAATCAGKNVLYFDAWLSDLTFENLWQSAVNHALCLLFINSEINLTNRQTLNKNSETWKFFFGSSAQTFKLTKVLEKKFFFFCVRQMLCSVSDSNFFPSAALSLHRCRRVAQRASLFHLLSIWCGKKGLVFSYMGKNKVACTQI